MNGRNRLATRLSKLDAATRLFFERGFDRLTIDRIAEAVGVDVGRMTVFNLSPRKDDMFFDREQEKHGAAFEVVRKCGPGVTSIGAARLLVRHLVEQQHSFIPPFDRTQRFVGTMVACEALKTRSSL